MNAIQAEQIVLGAVMRGELSGRVIDKIGRKLFYDPAHRRVFDKLADLRAIGSFDVTEELSRRLSGDTALNSLGGPEYINDLLEMDDRELPDALLFVLHDRPFC